MNTSRFVGSFAEISDLSPRDQAEILERARLAAFSVLRLGGRAALYLLLTILTGFIVAAVATSYTGLAMMPLWAGLGVLMSVLFYQRLMKGILHQGLLKVLESENT